MNTPFFGAFSKVASSLKVFSHSLTKFFTSIDLVAILFANGWSGAMAKKEAPNIGTHHLDQKYQLVSGKLFRKIKLDEFPQLINVLMGDINLIGPRPGLTSQKELTKARSANGVYEIKPGITGLSQVLGYDMSDPLKLAEVDKLYIENKSIFMDFLILLGTFVRFPKNYLIKLIT